MWNPASPTADLAGAVRISKVSYLARSLTHTAGQEPTLASVSLTAVRSAPDGLATSLLSLESKNNATEGQKATRNGYSYKRRSDLRREGDWSLASKHLAGIRIDLIHAPHVRLGRSRSSEPVTSSHQIRRKLS